MKRLLNILDWNTISSFMTGCNSSMSSLNGRIASLEAVGGLGGLNTRVSACEATGTAHNGRITATEANIVAHNARIASVETWRANKAPASANVSTNWTIPTAVITLGLNAPTAAGLKTIVDTIMTEVNQLKQILRDREILAT